MTIGGEEGVGRRRVVADTVGLARARQLAATLDLDPETIADGDLLPRGWHWIYCRDTPRRSDLAPDGHERRGNFLPALPLERRMWAGGRLRFGAPLTIGARMERVSTVRSIRRKEGRSGPLAFVTVQHRVSGPDGLAIEEEQELVYRSRGADEAGVPRHGEGEPSATWSESFVADEVTLFRFSALTFNAHRIHYDRMYAGEIGGYPGPVVHGPLLALLLLDAGIRWVEAEHGPIDPDEEVRFAYRALRPTFCLEHLRLCGAVGPGREGWPLGAADFAVTSGAERANRRALRLWVSHAERGVAMRAELVVGS